MNDRPDPLPDVLTDLLADHDAGLPVDPSALTDARARSVLDALAATRAELAAVPPVAIPPDVAARWSAALAAATTPPARVDRSDTPSSPVAHGRPTRADPAEPTHRPDRRSGPASRRPDAGPGRARRPRTPRPAVVAGLVLAVVLVVAGVVGLRRDPPSITAAQLGGVARAAVGVREAGPFTDPVRREACLRAVGPPGLAPDAPLAGGRSVVFEGRPGVVLLLLTGKLATFRAVVVTPDCDARLADTLIGP